MNNITKWFKKYFVPHKHNDFKPHLLRYEASLIMLVFIIVVEAVFLLQVFVIFDKTNFLASVLPGVLVNITNEQREDNGLSPLVVNELLTKAAQMKAEDMAKNGYFAHTSPEGKTPWYWFNQVGYLYSMAGENLAVNFFESEDVAQAWMNSPTHRANIVKANYKEIGIGIAKGYYEGRSTVFVAQLFGTPVNTIPKQQTTTQTTTETKTVAQVKPKSTTTNTQKPKQTENIKPVENKTSETTTNILGEETNTVATKSSTVITSTSTDIKDLVSKIASSPREYINYIYALLGILVGLVLMLMIVSRKEEAKHPHLLARGLTIVIVIISISFINFKLLENKTDLPSDEMSAIVIEAFQSTE